MHRWKNSPRPQTGLKKANEKVPTDVEMWSYRAFKTIELKIESVPY